MVSTKAIRCTVLHFHGLGGSAKSQFASNARKLVESRNLHFKSVEYPSTNTANSLWNVDRWLKDVVDELDSKQQPSILLGVSAGCHSVLRATLQRPSSVAGLLLISPGVGLSDANKYARMVLPHEVNDLIKGKSVVHPHYSDGRPTLIDMHALRHYSETCASKMDHVPIQCPVAMVHGECDQVVPYGNVEKFAKKLDSTAVNLRVLPNVGHRVGISENVEGMFDWLLDAISSKRTARTMSLSRSA